MKYQIKHTRGLLLKNGRAHGPWRTVSIVCAGEDKTAAKSKLLAVFDREQPYRHGVDRWGWDLFRTCDNYNDNTRDVYQVVDESGKDILLSSKNYSRSAGKGTSAKIG